MIILSLVLFVSGKFHFDQPLKNYFNNVFQPFFSYASLIIHETKQTVWSFFHFYQLKKENETLTLKLSKLEKQLLETKEIKQENKRFHKLLDFKSQMNFQTIPARIIGQDFSNWYNSIIINKGTRNGVFPDQAVLSLKGVVGKVMESFKNSAKIMLISDKNSQVGGLVLRTRDIGILQGMNKDFLTLNFLTRTSEIKKGDLIITSGFDSLFPKGIILGEVINVYDEDFGLYKYADIAPTVNFNKLEEVLVIFNKQDAKT